MKKDRAINRRIRAVMEIQGLRQRDLARLSGIPYEDLNRIVNDRRPVYAQDIPPLARSLGVGVEVLLKMGEEE